MSGMLLSIPEHVGNCKAISEHFSVKFFNPKNLTINTSGFSQRISEIFVI